MRLEISAATHKGYTRSNNEDAILVGDWIGLGEEVRRTFPGMSVETPFLVVIADGMGGHNAGEIASRIVVEELQRNLQAPISAQAIAKAIHAASFEIYQRAVADSELVGMGSTVVGAVIQPQSVTVFNVGDSRAYLMSAGTFSQISVDDVLSEGRGSNNASLRHAVTQSLGGSTLKTRPRPHIRILPPASGSLLLCSDGLTDMLGDEKIARLMRARKTETAQALLEAALEEGGMDNVSVIVAKVIA